MNGLQSLEQWREYFGHPDGVKLGAVNAAQSIGSLLAIPIVGDLADRFGRKPVLTSGIVIIIIATIIQAASINLPMFVISRLVVGFGGMFVVQPSPMLIAELAYPTHRGKFTSAFWTLYYLGKHEELSRNMAIDTNRWLLYTGAILASWTTYGTQEYEGEWSWRIPSILQAGFPIVQLMFVWWVPESPRWLVARDRAPQAAAILARYHSDQVIEGEAHTPLVAREVSEIIQSIQMEKEAKQTGWKSLVATPGNRKRTLIAICVGAFAQWNGIGIVSYYLTLVLNTIGITASSDQTLINGLLQLFNFGAALSAAFLVDRLGRRTLFIWSSVGMLVSYIVWTACSAVVSNTGSKSAGIVVVVCLFTYYFHYDIAWTPLLFGYPTEIFPYTIRSKGIAVELFAIYSSLVIAAFCNPIGMENIGWKYYIVFCCLLAVFLVIVIVLFPETKGHSLEEIAVIFDGPSAATVPSKTDEGERDVLESKNVPVATHMDRV